MISILEKSSLEDARRFAYDEASEIGGSTYLVTVFKQGERHFISTVFPVAYIVHNIKVKHIKKDKNLGLGLKEVELALNRPLDPEHAKSTKEYLLRNYKTKYILPGLALNVQGGLNVYVGISKTNTKAGYLVLPMGVVFTITDGQHRKAALDLLYEELTTDDFNEIATDGIPVMITAEDDVKQIHQDFSDCSKTKQLPKSLIAVYDTRNPANALVMDLVNKCLLFSGKVDAASNSLSKNSTKLVLVSQIRSLIKELFLGNSSTGDLELEKRAHEQYGNSTSTYTHDVNQYISYINKLTDKIEILKKVSKLNDGVEMVVIPELRREYLILNSAGLNILGRIGNILFKEKKDIDTYVDLLSKIDWRKNAEIWKGNIVQSGSTGDKIATSNSTLKEAVRKVMIEIGLDPKENITKKPDNKIKDPQEVGLFENTLK